MSNLHKKFNAVEWSCDGLGGSSSNGSSEEEHGVLWDVRQDGQRMFQQLSRRRLVITSLALLRQRERREISDAGHRGAAVQICQARSPPQPVVARWVRESEVEGHQVGHGANSQCASVPFHFAEIEMEETERDLQRLMKGKKR